jgi:hypothetical protein
MSVSIVALLKLFVAGCVVFCRDAHAHPYCLSTEIPVIVRRGNNKIPFCVVLNLA